jgi:hypothetical protein
MIAYVDLHHLHSPVGDARTHGTADVEKRRLNA